MGHSLRVSRPYRSLTHHLRYRVALIAFFILLINHHHLFFKYRESLAAKYSPTEFSHSFEQYLSALDEESARFQNRLLANRAAWEPLREGWEGRTFVYEDSVIKTFTPGRSPFRNCAPDTADETWPSEIPASLYFGGSEHNSTYSHDGFLPVRAFFMAASSTSEAEWHLVTPLSIGGSLQNLAAKIRKQQKTYREIDAHYRTAFNGLLGSLQILHEAGYCHDDIKPGNVFVASDRHWILGDLGNLRHVSHPYHTSLIWKENRQLPDCRDNDVFRALKTYLRFVRDAAIDVSIYNSNFFEGQESLSRLYWSVASDVTRFNSEELRTRSAAFESAKDGNNTVEKGAVAAGLDFAWVSNISRRSALTRAVDRALQTRMGEKMARWWALTWLFGVPVTNACGVRYPGSLH